MTGLRTYARHAIATAFVVVVMACSLVAQNQTETTVRFDPARTTVTFTLADILHTVRGSFKLTSGVIHFTPATGAASGALVVDATTGNSGNRARDSKMHRDVLDSRRYPEIVFVPQTVSGAVTQGASQVTVKGVFRMHGSERPLTLVVPITVTGNNIVATTQFPLSYQDWGVKNPSTFLLRVSDKVQISITGMGTMEQERVTANRLSSLKERQ